MKTLALLKELIKVDSSTKENANQLIAFSKKYLDKQGIQGKIIENKGYMSYVSTIGTGDKTLILNGHMDVVSGKAGQFEPIEAEGKLYGRGAADMKGGCAAMMQAFCKLADMPLKCKVMLQIVSDEETGGFNCTKHLADTGYLGDFVICTEPTQMNPSIQSKGMIKVDIITTGRPAHGSRPWEGDNAIEKAFKNYEAIRNLPILKESGYFYESSTVNLALIEGGDIYNRVPATCRMGLDIRYVPHLNPREIVAQIQKQVCGRVEIINIEPGVLVEPTHPYIEIVAQAISRVTPDADFEIVGQHGGSDARFFASRGIPAIELGPKGDNWHGDGEYVDIQSVKDLEQLLVEIARIFE